MWVREINGLKNEEWHRYEVSLMFPEHLLLQDEDGVLRETTIFRAYKHWRDNDGKWRRCGDSEVFITAESLMNKFIAVDSDAEKALLNLIEYKRNVQEKNLEESLTPFCLNAAIDIESDNEAVTNLDVITDSSIPSAEK